MIRRIAVIVSFAVAGFVPALAQTQTPPHPQHPQGRPHHPGPHPPMDPALHAAMHARLVGTWAGTLSAPDGTHTKLHLAVSSDKHGKMALKVDDVQAMKAGSATNVALDGHGLHWTHKISGESCQATAALESVTHHAPETMKGTMACGHREIPFTLQKSKN